MYVEMPEGVGPDAAQSVALLGDRRRPEDKVVLFWTK